LTNHSGPNYNREKSVVVQATAGQGRPLIDR
jgi:hypothetical protein